MFVARPYCTCYYKYQNVAPVIPWSPSTRPKRFDVNIVFSNVLEVYEDACHSPYNLHVLQGIG